MNDTKYFIQKAIAVHGNKYDYSKTVYVKSNAKVIITCKIHGDFEITPNNHLRGRGVENAGYLVRHLGFSSKLYEFAKIGFKIIGATFPIQNSMIKKILTRKDSFHASCESTNQKLSAQVFDSGNIVVCLGDTPEPSTLIAAGCGNLNALSLYEYLKAA